MTRWRGMKTLAIAHAGPPDTKATPTLPKTTTIQRMKQFSLMKARRNVTRKMGKRRRKKKRHPLQAPAHLRPRLLLKRRLLTLHLFLHSPHPSRIPPWQRV
jgi:hypothetical protein